MLYVTSTGGSATSQKLLPFSATLSMCSNLVYAFTVFGESAGSERIRRLRGHLLCMFFKQRVSVHNSSVVIMQNPEYELCFLGNF